MAKNEAPSSDLRNINSVAEEKEPLIIVEEDEEMAPSTTGGKSEEDIVKGNSSSWRDRVLLGLAMIALICCSVISSVFRKRMYNAFGSEYTFFRQELTNLMYNVWASVVLIGKILFTKDITKEMWTFPKWKFALLGFLDGASDFLGSVGGVHTAGSWQVLLNQTLVLFIMFFAFFILKSRYNVMQITGVLVVIAGASLAVLPNLADNSHYWYSVLIFTSNNLPAGLSYVTKEYYFKAAFLDVFYLTTFVSWIQLVLSWAFVPILSLPGFGGISLSDIPSVFKDGFYCFIGDSSIPVTGGTQQYCSSYNTWVTFVFSVSGFFAGILQLWMMKNSSAVLMIVVTAISLPLANLAFSLDFLMGVDVESFSWYDVGGLALVVAGFLVYNLIGSPLWRIKSDEKGANLKNESDRSPTDDDDALHR